MSPELQKQVLLWHLERGYFNSQAERLKTSAKELGRLNTIIYDKCKEENIDITTLNLSHDT